ncbi:MAG: DNA translocase FtsK 4TM domain-containing protein [Candidatus Magasanikbacteria bacterium]|nr:DNA translocase FtsK 4TM domain-containing protein [Candidatus Magasanikbacteria bacterium]
MGRHRTRKLTFSEQINLNPDISRGLLAILLFILGGLSALSFFNLAGLAGQFIDSFLAITFGQVRYIFPIIVILVSILIVRDMEYEYRATHWLGSILFILGFNGLVHLQKPAEEMFAAAMQGYGGGLVGYGPAWLFNKYIGYWGATMLLVAFLLVGIIFLFNTSLARIVELHKKFLLLLGWFGQQIINFFASFKKGKEAVAFKIKGDYQEGTEEEDLDEDTEETEETEEKRIFEQRAIAKKESQEEVLEDESEEEQNVPDQAGKLEMVKPPKPIIRDLPPIDLLYTSKSKPTSGDIKGNAAIIHDTLENFGIEVDMGEVRVGPTVTQYSLKPAKGIKLTRITTLGNDLSLALAAHPIRIEAPIPGQSLVGIEVPNQKVAMVTLRELLESPEFKNPDGHSMMIALGKDVAGKVWFGDLLKMPHLLVAGSTGSGKTVCINTIILSLLYQNTAATLRMIMVDPKRVELTLYNGIPHLLTPVITDAAKTVNALKWTIGEMDRRFTVLADAGKRDIGSYNKSAAEPMPYIVFVIDELADLMAMAASEVEAGIIRLAQMARAVGIHLIVATQRPSVEVITGLMKANIPARIAFSVASLVDSRTILDSSGAEKLLGRGDMLFLTADLSKPKRLQGAFVSEEEMKRVIDNLKGDEPPVYDDSITSKNSGSNGGTANMFGGSSSDFDPLFDEAKKVIIESGKASASLLQRRMKVGYARAARLLDELEEAGIVGPADGAKPRELFTEHMRPSESDDIPEEKQTLDAGGAPVFTDPNEENTQ